MFIGEKAVSFFSEAAFFYAESQKKGVNFLIIGI